MKRRHGVGMKGRWGRAAALTVLALALAGGMALGTPPAAAAPTSNAICGSTMSGCGPQYCDMISPMDMNQPAVAPMGGANAWLSRTSGLDGSTVGVSGSNWPAGAAVEVIVALFDNAGEVDVLPESVAHGVVSGDGNLTIPPFIMAQPKACASQDTPPPDGNANPAAPPLQSQMLLVVQVAGQARVSLEYTIFPSPHFQALSPSPVNAGAPILVSGSGWDPSQSITITPEIQSWPSNGLPSYDTSDFTPLASEATSVTAAADGSFAHTIQTPVEPPETLITYSASATSPLYGAFTIPLVTHFAVLPTTTTTLAISSSAGLAGSTVTLTGTNWPANQAIQISDCPRSVLTLCYPGSGQNLTQTRADAAGHIRATVRIPVAAQPGAVLLQASPALSPFDLTTYAQALPYSVTMPWNQAHPRQALALRIAPIAAAGLFVALLILVGWLLFNHRHATRKGVEYETEQASIR